MHDCFLPSYWCPLPFLGHGNWYRSLQGFKNSLLHGAVLLVHSLGDTAISVRLRLKLLENEVAGEDQINFLHDCSAVVLHNGSFFSWEVPLRSPLLDCAGDADVVHGGENIPVQAHIVLAVYKLVARPTFHPVAWGSCLLD